MKKMISLLLLGVFLLNLSYAENKISELDKLNVSENKQSLWIAAHNYAIKKISGNQIYVELTENELKDNFNSDKYLNLNWSLLNTKKKFVFIFEFDGDYVDIYVNDKKHFFATFCKYDISTYNQLIDMINTNECEPWMIEYPKRANGSIDFVSSK